MKRLIAVAIGGGVCLLLGGCAVDSMPSIAEVTEQTKASLQEIVDLMPPGAVATPRPDQEPNSCGGSAGKGSFYTGAVDVTLPPGTDVPALVAGLPSRLGDDWQESSVPKLPLPRVELRDEKTRVQVNVMGSKPEEEAPWIYLNGISRCGSEPTR